jgi:hypothetical protein
MTTMTEPDENENENEDDDAIAYAIERRTEAQRGLAEVELLLLQNRPRTAESRARESLVILGSSLNWLEDTERFEEAHALLDQAGAYVRRTFGCQLRFTGSGYELPCPVAVAHKRLGVSPEIIVDGFDCTICGLDEEQCEHISGRVYDGERCRRRARGRMRIIAVAWVSRPEQPDARLSALPVPLEKIKKLMPAGWQVGMPVPCDRCLFPCDGVEEFDLDQLREAAA